ncbi:DUF2141 domain-containing protein [Winogradskyella sp. UBA3174]|uniref:DUF2141 domain-containing protein n=1 Tax=Winogradskyella sp. UBA3174 TaxID=1947785 RepID=UPI0025F8A4D3|nr:DUF2141 domain-containing protein [Winogradskyella sp. UBA3174]|tara:strand:- start:1123 stop:1545 length:423 start_codon:yes stop_codon:yes gene_type:complete
MNVLTKIVVLLILSIASTMIQPRDTFTITVTVEEAESDNGKILLALYDSESNFLGEMYKGTKSELANNSCTIIFNDIPKGSYAISIFHDENDNGKMDTNFIGIPKEDYGFSNDAKGFVGPPKWKDAKFELNSDKILKITL